MNVSESEFLSLDLEDQEGGGSLDRDPTNEEYEDDDDVFFTRTDESNSAAVTSSSLLQKEALKKRKNTATISSETKPTPSPICAVQWSISHRCLDCAWKAIRGGRPQHPIKPPILPPGAASPPLVTLQSLGTTRDSGYEPSPTSAFSFTFTSDDDDDDTEIEEESDYASTKNLPPTLVTSGVTPPINIPAGGLGSTRYKSRSALPGDKRRDPRLLEGSEGVGVDTPDNGHGDVRSRRSSAFLRRSKSMPELWASERVIPRTPIVIRGEGLGPPHPPTPTHGRNYSLPATTSDGRPLLFAPSPPAPSSPSSRERLIDLTEDGSEGSSGHHRRVLVLALPDLLVDVESIKRREGGVSPSFSPSLHSPSGCSTSSKDTNPCSPVDKRSKTTLKSSNRAHLLPERSYSSSSTPSNASSSDACDIVVSSRPTWRRPRALSCDVTLEVEFGQELRKIADNFSRNHFSRQGGVWRALKNSLGRRFSLGIAEREVSPREATEERESQSLPTSPYHNPSVQVEERRFI